MSSSSLSAFGPDSSPAGDLHQAEAHLGWWFNGSLADPQVGRMDLVLATIPRLDKTNGRSAAATAGRAGTIGFHAFDAPKEAALWAVEKSALVNVYVHPALHAPDRPHGKGATHTARCLPGVVADLDAQSPFRSSNEGKAPDVAALALVIADFEQHYQFPVTAIDSGYGIYACVRFREPLWLEDQTSRADAETLLARFTEGLRVFARRRGWPNTVDRVPLAGLIRVAGTLNRKGDPPCPVHFTDARNGGAR
jgi:hypothetical protein